MKRSIIMAFLPVSVLSTLVLPTATAASYPLKVELILTSDNEYFEGYIENGFKDEYEETDFLNPDGSPILVEVDYVPTKKDMASAIEECKSGRNDYKIRANSTIKVINESSKVVGLGKLATVKIWQDPEENSFVYHCKFLGTVKVNSAKFYKLFIDGRNGPDYSFAELQKGKWTVRLVL